MWGLQQFNCLVLPGVQVPLTLKCPSRFGVQVSERVSCVSVGGKEIEQPQKWEKMALYLDDLRG